MRTPLLIGLGAAALLASQRARREKDDNQAISAWGRLVAQAGVAGGVFDPAMVAGLPEPARRFFLFAILPGARLGTAVELSMDGELFLGTRAQPRAQRMHAQQLLAPPHGLVWRVQAETALMRVCGSDGMVGAQSWTRFWLYGVIPIVRAGGDPDHLRSSFGRVVAEGAFWAPASLLPQAGVSWAPVDENTARATVCHAGMRQELDIRVDAQGRPLWVRMPRWSNANPKGVYREQPFGGEVSDFREVQGFRVPFRVDGGNFFGTPDYFPFYRARVRSLRVL